MGKHTPHTRTTHKRMPARLLYSEKRYHSGCGKRCVRCWSNKLQHACPEAQARAQADQELFASQCADQICDEMRDEEMVMNKRRFTRPSEKLAMKAVRMEKRSAKRGAVLTQAATKAAWREDRLADRDASKTGCRGLRRRALMC